jgi:phenylacetate-CoA ligase
MQRIIGRVSDIPRIKGMFVVPRHIQHVLERYPELGRFQLVVDRPAHQDELSVKVVLAQPVDQEQLRRRLIRDIRDAIRLTADVVFVEAVSLPADAPVFVDQRKLE